MCKMLNSSLLFTRMSDGTLENPQKGLPRTNADDRSLERESLQAHNTTSIDALETLTYRTYISNSPILDFVAHSPTYMHF